MSVDTISKPTEEIEPEAVAYHPEVLKRLAAERAKLSDIAAATPDNLDRRQGQVAAIDWFLRLPAQILEEQRKTKK